MKKKIILSICLLIIIAIGLYLIWNKNNAIKDNNIPDIKSNKIDAVSYNMKLDLDINTKSLMEEVEIEIKNDTYESIDEIIIRDMTPSIHAYNKKYYNNDKQKSNIISIKSNEQQLEYKIEKESIIKVKLNELLKSNDITKLKVEMKTDIPDRQDRFGYVKRKDGYIYALSFCFPYLADNQNGEWVLSPYFDDGESRSYDLANYEIEIKHPKDYLVIATGKEETKDGVTKITANNVRDIAIVVSNMMQKDTFEAEGIEINNYYLNSKYTDKYRNLTELVIKDAFKVYTNNIGKYPYEELDVTPLLLGFGYGGMEYPGLIMTNATSFYDGTLMDPWSLSDGLSHEIAHQWFYATVGNNEYSEAWIDEGFTTYLEKQLFGLYDGDAHKYLLEIDDIAPSIEKNIKSRDELIETAREDYKDKFLNTTPDNYSEEQEYGEIEYQEAYMFLQELRIAMGDDKFNLFLKELYNKYYLKEVNTDIIISLIKEHDNSERINEIIKFYFK